MTFTTFYIMTTFISLLILVLFVRHRVTQDIACRDNPRCYATVYITYFEITALAIAAIIPFVNIAADVVELSIILKDKLNIPAVKGINNGK